MAIQLPIKMSDIAAEFGGTSPHALSEYYRKNGLVPDFPQNANVPESGIIKFSQFEGASNVQPISLSAGSGGTIFVTDPASPYNSTVAIRFNPDGSIETGKSTNGQAIVWTSRGNWINPTSAVGSGFSVRYTNRTGTRDFTLRASPEDVWISLGAFARLWSWNSTSLLAAPNNSFTCDFEVRDDDGQINTASTEYTFIIENAF